MEHAFGDWEGLTKLEIKARFPGEWRNRNADRWNLRVPGGESHAVVSARVAEWLAEQDEDGRLIVVSHGMAGRALRARYAGLPGDAITSLTEDHAKVFRLAGGTIASFDSGGC
jgi:probable phosphoglycerate mutase